MYKELILNDTNQLMENNEFSSDNPYDITSNDKISVMFYLLYSTIFSVGLFGNLLVCYAVFRNKSMQTVTNLFIVNLALSDILLCFFAVPFTPLYLLTFKNWIFGHILCHLVPYVQSLSVYISSFTLMSIAIHRFVVIMKPFKSRIKVYVCINIITVIWIFTIFLTLPFGYYMNMNEQYDELNQTIYLCDENWTKEDMRKTFVIISPILQFVLPFIITLYCYIKICKRLSQRVRCMSGSKSAKREEADREKTRRTNRMLMVMVLVFGLSWLPLNCHNLIQDFNDSYSEWAFVQLFFLASHLIAMSSTCYNPFFYAWLNDNFRKEFKQVLPCFKQSQLRRHHSSKLSERNTLTGQTRESSFFTNSKIVNH